MTKSDPQAARPPDLVDRRFFANRPNQLWVTDLTYVATWAGMAYVCLITDVFSRMIVGWRIATHMRPEMVLEWRTPADAFNELPRSDQQGRAATIP